jgi:hypothetical protein
MKGLAVVWVGREAAFPGLEKRFPGLERLVGELEKRSPGLETSFLELEGHFPLLESDLRLLGMNLQELEMAGERLEMAEMELEIGLEGLESVVQERKGRLQERSRRLLGWFRCLKERPGGFSRSGCGVSWTGWRGCGSSGGLSWIGWRSPRGGAGFSRIGRKSPGNGMAACRGISGAAQSSLGFSSSRGLLRKVSRRISSERPASFNCSSRLPCRLYTAMKSTQRPESPIPATTRMIVMADRKLQLAGGDRREAIAHGRQR